MKIHFSAPLFRVTLAVLAALGCCIPVSASAQRLSQAVRPEHYTLALTPDLLPPLEFTGPDLVAREVAFVQADKLALGQVPEFLPVGLRDAVLLHPGRDICRGGFPVHPPAHHLADDLPQRTSSMRKKSPGKSAFRIMSSICPKNFLKPLLRILSIPICAAKRHCLARAAIK